MSPRTLVLFRTSSGRYALPVEQVQEVRPGGDLLAVPLPRPGVLGLLPAREGDAVLPVVGVLGDGREHVVVVQEPRGVFGLRVELVEGLVRVPEEALGPAPQGQHQDVVVGVVRHQGDLVLLVDAGRLGRAVFGDGDLSPGTTLKGEP